MHLAGQIYACAYPIDDQTLRSSIGHLWRWVLILTHNHREFAYSLISWINSVSSLSMFISGNTSVNFSCAVEQWRNWPGVRFLISPSRTNSVGRFLTAVLLVSTNARASCLNVHPLSSRSNKATRYGRCRSAYAPSSWQTQCSGV